MVSHKFYWPNTNLMTQIYTMTRFKVIPVFRTLLSALAVTVSAAAAVADPGVIKREDLVPFENLSWAVPNFKIPEPSPGLPLLDLTDNSPEATLLRRLERQGRLGGFADVVYDNHDRGHSLPEAGSFPRVSQLYFSKELRKLELDYGLAGKIILPAIVIGNSSTAITKGHRKRSQPRLAMTTKVGPLRAFLTYASNHLYIYPEHRDHDKADLFPANWPYMVITQGSSHSDKPFIRALLMTVAALSPATQRTLKDKNLIAPTLQMILRRSMKPVYSRQAYWSGVAHPTAFSRKQLMPERMVALASALKPGEIPPMVQLEVEQEDFVDQAGLAGLSERMFDTPSAIARNWRGFHYTKNMVVSASKTADPNGHDLTFAWVLLRGDPERVRITPVGDSGAKAEISIDWHHERRISATEDRTTSRVDIGVFAWNGFHDSAPAMISINFPNHQKREYQNDPIGDGKRLIAIDYDAEARKIYYDPALFWSAPWVDFMIYDDETATVEIRRAFEDRSVTLASLNRMADGQTITYNLTDKKKFRTMSMDVDLGQ